MLLILNNTNKRIRVQPTSISRRRSGIKSSLAQPSGRKPSLRTHDQNIRPARKRKKQQNRRRNLSLNVNLSQPNAGHNLFCRQHGCTINEITPGHLLLPFARFNCFISVFYSLNSYSSYIRR